MRILVTGGAGYVGSHTVRHLAEHGHEVWVYDNLSTGHRAAVVGEVRGGGHIGCRLPAERFLEGDLLDGARLHQALSDHGVEAVVHFAAFTAVNESVAQPAKYYRNNVVGTLSLLEAMRGTGVRRLVFSSTAAVYGAPLRVPIAESALPAPINPYGFTKLAMERAMADYSGAYGVSYAALRYFNAAGAAADGSLGEDHDPETHLVPLVLQAALGKRAGIRIFGTDYPTPDGTCIRDYVHVEDLAVAHRLALEHLAAGTSAETARALVCNLGTGRGHSVREVIEAAGRVTGRAIAVVEAGRRAGDPAELVASPELAGRELGWLPRYTELDEIVETAWRWHRDHPDGYGQGG